MVVGSPAHKKAVQSLWVGKATITVLDGVLNPATAYGNLMMTLQVGLCLIMVALATGIMFARASRAKAKAAVSITLRSRRIASSCVNRSKRVASGFDLGSAE